MKTWSKFIVVTIAGCLSALLAGAPAHAAEITVVAGGGPLPDVMGTLLPMFESATGNKVKISFKGGPEVTADVKKGAADLVITGTEQVDDLAKNDDVASDGKTLLMISKVGIAVKAGASKTRVNALMASGTHEPLILTSMRLVHDHGRSIPLRLSTSCACAERRKLTSARAVAESFALAETPAE